MLHENLKRLRTEKGLSQEELASRLHIVRQTVSKWEKGLSVPDADMLLRIAEVFNVPVSELLGAEIETPSDLGRIAEQLSHINEQLAIKNRRSRRIWKVISAILISLIVATILWTVLSLTAFHSYHTDAKVTTTTAQEVVE